MHRLVILVIGLVIALGVGFGIVFGWRWFETVHPPKPPEKMESAQMPDASTLTEELLGKDLDEHGCNRPAEFSWCEEKQKCLQIWEEHCGPAADDDVFAVLKNIRQRVLGFSYPKTTTFSWLVPAASLDQLSNGNQVAGLEIAGPDFSAPEQEQTVQYLKDAGFLEDKYNMATTESEYVRGFSKDSIVCRIKSEKTDSNREFQQTMQVYCGHFSISRPVMSASEQAMKTLLAKKYSKSEDEVFITVSKEDATHIRGIVEFAPGGPENTGMFLALKDSGKWVAFDGNGIPNCDMLKAAKFSASMLEGICD